MVERAVLLIFLGGMVFRVGVLPWNYGRTGGSINFWGRNVFKVGGFSDGILVVWAVVSICGGEMVFFFRAVNGSLATRRHMSRMIHSTSDRFSRQTVSTDLDESRSYTQMPTGSNRRLSGASFIRELSLADDDTPALSQNFNLKPPGIHISGVTCHARH